MTNLPHLGRPSGQSVPRCSVPGVASVRWYDRSSAQTALTLDQSTYSATNWLTLRWPASLRSRVSSGVHTVSNTTVSGMAISWPVTHRRSSDRGAVDQNVIWLIECFADTAIVAVRLLQQVTELFHRSDWQLITSALAAFMAKAMARPTPPAPSKRTFLPATVPSDLLDTPTAAGASVLAPITSSSSRQSC